MLSMRFFKYQGTGNDFILLDQRRETNLSRADRARIERLCDRRFGIGSDGLILLQNRDGFDFEMVYFNADGRESSMCGNGGRCIAAFAHSLGVFKKKCRFWAIDGPHEASVSRPGNVGKKAEHDGSAWVELKMSDVQAVENQGDRWVLNTGSPHFVQFKKSLAGLDVFKKGRAIRNSPPFREAGINVNFVEKTGPFSIRVATYERGVEDETLSCGTGVTAAAITFYIKEKMSGPAGIAVSTKGGELAVRFEPDGRGGFREVWLCGPAAEVFSGEVF